MHTQWKHMCGVLLNADSAFQKEIVSCKSTAKSENTMMSRMNDDNTEDIEATDDEMKAVCYTAIFFIGVVTVLIGSVIFFPA